MKSLGPVLTLCDAIFQRCKPLVRLAGQHHPDVVFPMPDRRLCMGPGSQRSLCLMSGGFFFPNSLWVECFHGPAGFLKITGHLEAFGGAIRGGGGGLILI